MKKPQYFDEQIHFLVMFSYSPNQKTFYETVFIWTICKIHLIKFIFCHSCRRVALYSTALTDNLGLILNTGDCRPAAFLKLSDFSDGFRRFDDKSNDGFVSCFLKIAIPIPKFMKDMRRSSFLVKINLYLQSFS